jgi:hypothetical protein
MQSNSSFATTHVDKMICYRTFSKGGLNRCNGLFHTKDIIQQLPIEQSYNLCYLLSISYLKMTLPPLAFHNGLKSGSLRYLGKKSIIVLLFSFSFFLGIFNRDGAKFTVDNFPS